MAWSLGLTVAAVRVSDDDASGSAEISSADHLSLTEQIAIRSAGEAAEDTFNCPAHELAAACDRHKILKLLQDNGISEEKQGPALRDKGYNFAKARLEIHKSRVIRLAERLVECGHVDAFEFLRLMAAQTGADEANPAGGDV